MALLSGVFGHFAQIEVAHFLHYCEWPAEPAFGLVSKTGQCRGDSECCD